MQEQKPRPRHQSVELPFGFSSLFFFFLSVYAGEQTAAMAFARPSHRSQAWTGRRFADEQLSRQALVGEDRDLPRGRGNRATIVWGAAALPLASTRYRRSTGFVRLFRTEGATNLLREPRTAKRRKCEGPVTHLRPTTVRSSLVQAGVRRSARQVLNSLRA